MGKQYDLANGICRFQVKDGILYSAGAVRDGRRTEYINEKQGFGKLGLTYVADGKRTAWKPLSSGTLKEEGVKRRGRDLYYRCCTENECLSVSVDYCLRADCGESDGIPHRAGGFRNHLCLSYGFRMGEGCVRGSDRPLFYCGAWFSCHLLPL